MGRVVEEGKHEPETWAPGGLAGWLLARMKRTARRQPQLALVERIVLAPRQTLALVEAQGRRLLVATSPEGAPTFYALDEPRPQRARRTSDVIPFRGHVC